jgi:hypothetical protein
MVRQSAGVGVTAVCVLGHRPNPELGRFLHGCPCVYRWPVAPSRAAIPVVREQMVRWFLVETSLDWLLQLDDDMLPDGDWTCLAPLLASTADVAGAAVKRAGGENGLQHGHQGGFACPCVRLSRLACLALPKPIFANTVAADGSVTSCECRRLWNSAMRAGGGFRPVIAGTILHP